MRYRKTPHNVAARALGADDKTAKAIKSIQGRFEALVRDCAKHGVSIRETETGYALIITAHSVTMAIAVAETETE